MNAVRRGRSVGLLCTMVGSGGRGESTVMVVMIADRLTEKRQVSISHITELFENRHYLEILY